MEKMTSFQRFTKHLISSVSEKVLLPSQSNSYPLSWHWCLQGKNSRYLIATSNSTLAFSHDCYIFSHDCDVELNIGAVPAGSFDIRSGRQVIELIYVTLNLCGSFEIIFEIKIISLFEAQLILDVTHLYKSKAPDVAKPSKPHLPNLCRWSSWW